MINQEIQDPKIRDQVHKVLHDLSAPVKSMGGLLQLLKYAGTDKEEYIQPLETCYHELDKRLQLLLDSFHGHEEPAVRIHPGDMVRHIIYTLSYFPGAREITFTVDDNTINAFYGPYHQVTSVFQNLIENAIKYRQQEHPRIDIKLYDVADGIEVIISDNGTGIPYEQQDEIFELFSRASTETMGRGIGLYNVKTTVDKLNGAIRLRSEPGLGTEFTLYIPSAE